MATSSLVTLDEALAFIDSCDDESVAESTRGAGTTDALLTFEALDELLNAASPPRKKKRYRERLQAEQTNKRIKEVRDRLQKHRKQLSGILRQEDTLQGYDFVKKLSSPVLQDSYFTVGYTSTIAEERATRVIFTRSEPKYDEKTQSRTLEIVTTTPLDSSVNAVVDALWTSLASTYAKGSEPNSLQGDRSVNLDHRGCAVHFDKLYFLRKFEEEERVIFIWSCFFLSSAKLQYRTLGYIVVAPAETNPSRGCVVHSELNLHMEYRGEQPAKGFDEAHNMALGAC
ncbi:hypothetical protein PHYSODRAFT_339453 [Phytophthora sojae]|uniref:Uncharacterized protein n=1 Tax=Phytophthora sojae (strain P6497) TaxID=1094619 RepID=G5A6X0_PHYSP|nr:hypothetical protein PHYSODRAFT_339453 [Phytophthora sojae]EGZ09075.1 hypothetical protein PHYSODRAFT_339453 [Phytophthora sojae]|eukprot:XP_009535708.1 hypothetical protein PHYSODRAFT_339453 [Phytophthora sojae]